MSAKVKDFITKLRALPEPKKKVIFFTIIILSALVIGFFEVISTKNSIAKIKESVKSVNLPKMDTLDSQRNALGFDAVNSTPTPVLENQISDWKTYTNEKLGFSLKYPLGFELQESDVVPDILGPEGILIVRKFDNLDRELSELKKNTSDTNNTKGVVENEIIIDGFTAKDISYEKFYLKPMSTGPFWEINIYIPEKSIHIFVQTKYQDSVNIFRNVISTFKFTPVK